MLGSGSCAELITSHSMKVMRTLLSSQRTVEQSSNVFCTLHNGVVYSSTVCLLPGGHQLSNPTRDLWHGRHLAGRDVVMHHHRGAWSCRALACMR